MDIARTECVGAGVKAPCAGREDVRYIVVTFGSGYEAKQ